VRKGRDIGDLAFSVVEVKDHKIIASAIDATRQPKAIEQKPKIPVPQRSASGSRERTSEPSRPQALRRSPPVAVDAHHLTPIYLILNPRQRCTACHEFADRRLLRLHVIELKDHWVSDSAVAANIGP